MRFATTIGRHSVAVYFLLAFVVSWACVVLLAGPGNLPIDPEKTKDILPLIYTSMLLGPSLAGILMITLTAGGAGLRDFLSRLIKWRVAPGYYILAILSAPTLAAIVLSALSLYSSDFHIGLLGADAAGLVVAGIGSGVMVGVFEEAGWSGFAVPRTDRRLGPLANGLLVGLIWGAWHFILFWEEDSFTGWMPFSILMARLFLWLPAYRVFMILIYRRTGSVLLMILAHTSLVFTVTAIAPASLTGTALLIWLLAWSGVLWVLAAVSGLVLRKPA